ncbi:hypothetical protein Tco_1525022, partial [Tanacetum coccineum]
QDLDMCYVAAMVWGRWAMMVMADDGGLWDDGRSK